ncbi:ABC transporter permease [Gracilibacillus sp. S3-1-1]|uniref:ABC transporter permease n=1 Tax=Gracilibacillus pellucidus TaxID=3095368 RepID=A0ACC6M3Q7_9BACI|nr:ABC transporter permease [Gracilibacillus sp. S3-1-1]MDX8045600.1 ABC transporter permease [Gracilibacillus sp. S3-1-1]
MKVILWAQFAKDKRNPLLVLALIVGSILCTLFFTSGIQTPTKVAIFSEEQNAEEIEKKWEEKLNENDSINFEITDPDEAREQVSDGTIELAIQLMEMDYRLLVKAEFPTLSYMQQYVDKVFLAEAQIESVISATGDNTMREEIEYQLANGPVQVVAQELDGDEVSNYNMSTQLMFAFTLLVAMFLAGIKINNVTNDKVAGVWNRMILSPISKTSMYLGYILYSFFVTMIQIIVVLALFKYVMNYELGDNLWLLILISMFFTFSIISIAMLITGLVKSPEQFYAIYPSLIPLIPLISGAYMNPGTITSKVLLFIADLFPMVHAMDATMAVIFYDAHFQDITLSLLFMLLIGIVAMGIGINLIERRGLTSVSK